MGMSVPPLRNIYSGPRPTSPPPPKKLLDKSDEKLEETKPADSIFDWLLAGVTMLAISETINDSE